MTSRRGEVRPPVHPLTARTLRKANAIAEKARRLGSAPPPGIALLARDYKKWRNRVATGRQPDTPGPGMRQP
jgi:hypothetical protein